MLKKTAAILLLGLLLFNWVGYRLLTSLMETRADRDLQARLDVNDYNDDQLISVKAPVTYLSYYQNDPEFESVKGKIEIGGIQYKYVKRRIFNDSLEVLCIPDGTAMKLRATKNSFFAFVNGLQQHTGEKKQNANSDTSKCFSPEYCSTRALSIYIIARRNAVIMKYADDPAPLSSPYAKAPEHPPRFV